MKFNLTKPCKDCPFRADCLKGWLGKSRATEIIHAITTLDGTFTCHKTNDYHAGKVIETSKSSHCAGVLIMLEKQGKYGRPNQMMRIAERIRLYDRTKLDMKAPVFNTTQQFIKHHTN